ncbi:hypothetical protein GLOIN_2v708233 [Rhizophagus clarus]|uniref:Reverse transcriptase domain-containing protein n=1 Tax=Rhizophagus clarus TaxID=94130 RepID=A0A8H3LWK8_9GLOM|nr:hypothetical protein GLOIN_2v708233 [Rhizophagus clarus]
MRKAVVKIITQKFSQIIANNNILKGGNYVALPGSSTKVPIRIINLIMEDAKVKKKPLWILFQDFSKARKAVITTTGITQFYKALIGIDQGEVISPLLWIIYYDPLSDLDKENVMISSQAYMDDINLNKFAIMTNDTNALKDKSIKLNFGSYVQEIQLICPTESVRILDAWMNLNLSKIYIFNQCKNIITGYNKIIRNKQLTNKMMRYMYNAVIISSIKYKSQHTISNDKQVAVLNILTRTLFKKKTNLVMTIPNCMIYSSLGYAIKDILTIQLQYQIIRLHNQLQNKGLLGTLSQLSIICLQQETLSVNNVLTGWLIHLKDLKIKFNLIASTLAIMYDNNLICQSNIKRKIIGDQLPITQVLNSDLLFKDRLNYHLQRYNIYFLSQIMAADGIRLLIYSDLRI